MFLSGSIFAGNYPEGERLYSKQSKSLFDSNEWIKKMNDGGFYLNIGLMIPKRLCYGLKAGSYFTGKFSPGPHLEIGNMLFISDFKGDNAIGLRATWFAASYSTYSANNLDMSYLQGSIIRLGPYFTYALNEEMALDAFYQIGPSFAWDAQLDTMPSGRGNTGYFGFTHNLGVDFRYKMFSAGIDMNFGNLKYTDKEEYKNETDEIVDLFYKIRTPYTRIFFGFRF